MKEESIPVHTQKFRHPGQGCTCPLEMMMKKTALSRGWEKLKADLKPMTFRQKLDHIWTYYKEYMFVAGMVLTVIVCGITLAINAGRHAYLNGILCNLSVSQEGHDYMVESYGLRHPEAQKDGVFLTSTIFEDPQTVSQVDSSYQAAMGVLGQIEAKMLDFIFMDEVGVAFFGSQEALLDLRDFLTEEEIAQWEDKFLYAQFEEDDGSMAEREPLALDVSELPFVKECFRTEDKVYLAIAGNLPRPEQTRQFWEDLLAWEKEAAAK